ncbi:MAG: hypothetical protein Q8O67_29000 [Deltaproteobacteria bacterium]|nr:hypothetical protein [Deltaproteobacteria bacterium]
MVQGIEKKAPASVGRIAENAAAAGITADQLQQLLSGVKFETGMFGNTTPSDVKQAFAEAAGLLAQQATAKRASAPPPKNADAERHKVISALDTGEATTACLQQVFAGKDLAGLSSELYAAQRVPSGTLVDFKLLTDAIGQRLPMPEAIKAFQGLADVLAKCGGENAQLPIPLSVISDGLQGIQRSLKSRGTTGDQAKTLAKAGDQIQDVLLYGNELKNPDGRFVNSGDRIGLRDLNYEKAWW